jgi:hypothetical protein
MAAAAMSKAKPTKTMERRNMRSLRSSLDVPPAGSVTHDAFDAMHHSCYIGWIHRSKPTMTKREKNELTVATKKPLFWVLVVAAATLVVSSFLTRANA